MLLHPCLVFDDISLCNAFTELVQLLEHLYGFFFLTQDVLTLLLFQLASLEDSVDMLVLQVGSFLLVSLSRFLLFGHLVLNEDQLGLFVLADLLPPSLLLLLFAPECRQVPLILSLIDHSVALVASLRLHPFRLHGLSVMPEAQLDSVAPVPYLAIEQREVVSSGHSLFLVLLVLLQLLKVSALHVLLELEMPLDFSVGVLPFL